MSFSSANDSPIANPPGKDSSSRGVDRASVVHARRLISAENHLAKGFAGQADLPGIQELFAQEVQASLEGGKAAILRPSKRRMLIAAGIKAGLRPFQTQLIMAQVQEERRHTKYEDAARATPGRDGIALDTQPSTSIEDQRGSATSAYNNGHVSRRSNELLLEPSQKSKKSPQIDRGGFKQLLFMMVLTGLLAGAVFALLVLWMG